MPVIDYARRGLWPRHSSVGWWLVVAVAVLAGLVLLVAGSIAGPAGIDLGWVDAVTGSYKSRTDRLWGWRKSPEQVTPSPLALRLRRMGVATQPDWRNIKGTYRDLSGRQIGSGHGWGPPIKSFRGELQQWWVDASTDAEILEFVRVMQNGTEDQQRAAVDAAARKGLAAAGAPVATKPATTGRSP